MSQCNSARQRDKAYDSPPWVARALAPFLQQRGARHLWELAIGAGNLAHTLRAERFQITGTSDDFLAKSATPLAVDAICTNQSARNRVHLFRDHPHFALSGCIGSCGLSAKVRSRARTMHRLFGTPSTAARRPSPTPAIMRCRSNPR